MKICQHLRAELYDWIYMGSYSIESDAWFSTKVITDDGKKYYRDRDLKLYTKLNCITVKLTLFNMIKGTRGKVITTLYTADCIQFIVKSVDLYYGFIITSQYILYTELAQDNYMFAVTIRDRAYLPETLAKNTVVVTDIN